MKHDWTIRWWDILALLLALGASVLTVQYSIMRSGAEGMPVKPGLVTIRVPNPLAAIKQQIKTGDSVINSKNEKVAEIVAIGDVKQNISAPVSLPFSPQDVIITLQVNGNLRLMRNLEGFFKEPAGLKAGVWCLISTPKLDISGMVINVSPIASQEEH